LAPADNLKYGGYIIKDCQGTPDIILIATGSEVSISLNAADQLAARDVKARVVSLPSTDLFDKQSRGYRDSVLPPAVTTRLGVEAAASLGWDRYVGPEGATICIDRFGESAPGTVMMEKFGFHADNIVKVALQQIGKRS
jgi:transketolase